MKIFVRSVNSKMLCLDVEKDSTVMDVKWQMEELEGIAIEDQRMLFVGKEVDDESTLESLEVTEGMNFDMNLRLLGGAVASDIPEHLKMLANKYKVDKMICRKCYARLPLTAYNCRKRKCGHCANIRPKKKIKDKEGKK